MADVGSLEEEAMKRKAKLKALKSKRGDKQEDVQKENQVTTERPRLKFRSYNPQTAELREQKLPKAKPESVEPQIKEQLEAAKEADVGEVNLVNLAPRKVDWDLKRDISKKLDRLERRTQRAIVELISERLQGEEGALASAVATAGREEREIDSD